MIISKRLSKKQSKQYIASIGEAVIINLLSSAVIEILTLNNITRGNLPDVIRNLINVYRGSNSYDAIGKYIQDHSREIDETIMSTLNIVKIGDEYLEKDPYYSSVKIDFAISGNMAYGPSKPTLSERKRGGRAITNDSVTIFDIAVSGEIPEKPYMVTHNLLHYEGRKWKSFPSLYEVGSSMVYMSVEPYEMNTLSEFLAKAKGNVLICGCGLGYAAYMAGQKEDVNNITILELSSDVINLFDSQVRHQLPKEVDVKHCDAYEFLETQDLSGYDCVYVDTWYDTNDMIDAYMRCLVLEEKYPNTKFVYWLEKKLLLDVKMTILYYVYEQVTKEEFGLPCYPMIKKLVEELSNFDGTLIEDQKTLDELTSEENLRRLLKNFALQHPEKAREFIYKENQKIRQLDRFKN